MGTGGSKSYTSKSSTISRENSKVKYKSRAVCAFLVGDQRDVEYIMSMFAKREDVGAKEKAMVNDEYEAQGMQLRLKEQRNEAQYAARKLHFANPQDNKDVGELLQWLNYQAFPPRTMHAYPKELEDCVANLFRFDGEINQLVQEVNRNIKKF